MKMQKLCLILTFFLSIIVSATAQVSPGTYTITNKNSNLCLAIKGATRNNGEEGTQWTCDGNADKNWKLIDAGSGYFKIQNENSNLFLAVGGASRDNGGRGVQYADQGQQDILWRFIDAGAGFHKIQNKNSGLFLGIGGGARTGGADLIQWGDEGQEDVKWKLTSDAIQVSPGKYTIQSELGRFLDVKGASPSPRTPIWIWDNNGSNGQKWNLVQADGEYFYIQSELGTYLDIKESSPNVRAEVWTWSLNRGNGQKWKLEPAGNDYYYIRSALGTYLDVKEANPNAGAQVWMWSKNESKGQKWKFHRIENSVPPQIVSVTPGDYFIKSGLGHRYLDVKEANASIRTPIWTWFFSGGNGQKWKIIPRGDGSYLIQSHLGKYLDIKEANANPGADVWTWDNNGSNGQRWYFQSAGQGLYYIVSALGTYLDVKEAKTDVGTPIWTWSLNRGKGQQWELVPLTATVARPNPVFSTFDVARHGFQFENRFEVPLIGDIKFKGLCGGMAYAANDYFGSGISTPTQNILPANGTPLQQYIFNRQQNSFASLYKFAEFTAGVGQRDEEFFYWGLEGRLYTTLKNSIDRNAPIPLGLFNVVNLDPFVHHQVLAIGYDMGGYREGRHWDPNKDKVRIFIYDPNYSNTICALVPNVSGKYYEQYTVNRQGNSYTLGERINKLWRSYFVDEHYQRMTPPRL